MEYSSTNRLCVCSRCIRKSPSGCQVPRTTFYRHQQEQESRLPQEDRAGGLRKCTSCRAFPNGHFTSRATYYRHQIYHQQCLINPSTYLLPLQQDNEAPFNNGETTPLLLNSQSSSETEDDSLKSNREDEEDVNNQYRLLETMLADSKGQQLEFNTPGKILPLVG